MPPTVAVGPRGDTSTSWELRSQWVRPNDILSLLLLVGGDVLQQALAQQSGDKFPTPVVFSFGWVAYAFTALLSAVGNDRLMPSPATSSSVILSTKHGYARTNTSWIVSRILRDYERLWMPLPVRRKLESMLAAANVAKTGLCISVFEASKDATAGVPQRDFYWFSGYAVALLQLGIAIIPWAVFGEWQIFLVTAAGTVLAFTIGSIPQWRRERWECRRNTKKTFVLSGGNGAQHVLVIQGAGRGLDLEDIATSDGKYVSTWKTKSVFGGLTICWGVLLLTVSGIKDQTWFLLAIGSIGMIHTVIVAGAPRRSEWFGVHLDYRAVFAERKVMAALQSAETAYPGLGRSMLPIFFPGDIREDEIRWWNRASSNNALPDLDRSKESEKGPLKARTHSELDW